ncbi:MAG: hypothetical protein L0I76_04135 [Pseudonocardia sp.]|nr:hypothetical protein [Pseudonocardia sp.]
MGAVVGAGEPESEDVPVTRIEVLDFVGDLFLGDPVSREALIRTAGAEGGRPALIEVLERLPSTTLSEISDLWRYLDVPEDLSAARARPPRPPIG